MTLRKTIKFASCSGMVRAIRFRAGNDIQDFLKNPPGAGESPQARLIEALINFDKPIVVAVQGAAIGGGTTMLTHCDFVFAGESAKFQMPFVNLALVPEFGSSYTVPARIGYLRAAELILLGSRFDAKRAAELGLVTRVVPDQELLATATANSARIGGESAGRTAGLQTIDANVNARSTRARGETRERGILRSSPLGRSEGSVHGIY